jgi:hypothetical protein
MTRLCVGLALLALAVVTLAGGTPARAQAAGQVDLMQLQFDLNSLPAVNELGFTKEQLTQLIPLIKRAIEEQKTIAARQAPIDAESLGQLVQIRDDMVKGGVGREILLKDPGAKASKNLDSALALAHQEMPASKEILALLTADQRDKLTRVTIMASGFRYAPPPPAPPSGPTGRVDDMTTALNGLERVRRLAEPDYQNRRTSLAEGTVERLVKRDAPDFRQRVEQLLKVFDQVRAMPQTEFDANKQEIARQHIVAYVHEEGGPTAPPPAPVVSLNIRPQLRALYDEKLVRVLELKLKSMQ